jgi:hypothetical protein
MVTSKVSIYKKLTLSCTVFDGRNTYIAQGMSRRLSGTPIEAIFQWQSKKQGAVKRRFIELLK